LAIRGGVFRKAKSPELTDEWFAKARPASEVLPGLFGEAIAKAMLKPKRGRPVLATNALREWIKTHPMQKI
jgi:uncharacterized protein (DUF4415 family)